jgi:hypothetical protein
MAILVVKNGWLLRRTGLEASCKTVAANGSDHWVRCNAGVLDGQPNLANDGCTTQWTIGHVKAWYCTGPIPTLPENI